MSVSLLAEVSAQVAQNNRPRNVAVRVDGFDLNPNGGLEDQKLLATTLDGRQVKVVMNPPMTDKAAQLRTTIVDLNLKPSRKIAEGAFVRLDRAILQGDTYFCDFIRRLTFKPNDDLNAFVHVQGRVNFARTTTKKAYGRDITVTRGRVDLIDDSAAMQVKGADAFKAAVQHFLIENPPSFAAYGRRGVMIRDPQTPQAVPRLIYINAMKLEGGGFREATPKEVLAQLQQNTLYTTLEQALARQPEYALDVLPAAAAVALDQTAGEREYTQIAKFFSGKFQTLGSGGQIREEQFSGFRDAIIGLQRKENGSPWYVVSVSHTGEGDLTLNGLAASKALRHDGNQQAPAPDVASNDAQPAADGAAQVPSPQASAAREADSNRAAAPAAGITPEQQDYAERDYTGYPEAAAGFDQGDSLESLLDEDDIDGEIHQVIKKFNSMSMD